MEIPIANRKKMTSRASLVSPDIAIITSIGHEGIERWKNIDRIIRYKLLIASAMKKGGRLLLPFDDVYYEKLLKEAQKYGNVKLLTYGSHSSCNAHIIEKHFNNFGWDVVAKIEGRLIAYRVPFFEEYALNASLCELLCAYHLGADIYECADRYYGCTNFKSSGLFYKVTLGAKQFYLYDQSNRGGIEGYESFFRTLRYLTPPNKGQKLLLTSEFVDYQDGEMAFIDTALFQKLITASGISKLYSVEKFSEHINVLEDKSIWKNHSIDFHNIQDEILHAIQNDTLFCVKGIFNSSLPKFVTYLKNIPDIKFEKIQHLNTMQEKNKFFKEQRHD